MSVLSLLLWSTTPLVGLAALLGMSRFERYLLEDRDGSSAGEDPWAANEAKREATEIASLAGIAGATTGTASPVEIAPETEAPAAEARPPALRPAARPNSTAA